MTKPHIPLEEIRAAVESCRKCPLADGRTQTVFGAGNPSARVLIVGEAPGRTRICRAFRSWGGGGQVPRRAAGHRGPRARGRVHRQRAQVPPARNRNPRPEEIELCTPVSAGADAHHRPRVHRDARKLLD